MTMSSKDWARRYDYREERINQQVADVMAEEAWAKGFGFEDAQSYHAATDEAFAESVRDDEGDPDDWWDDHKYGSN